MENASALRADEIYSLVGSTPSTPTKIYGPYQRGDKRSIVILVKDGIRLTVSYPRFLMEMHLGRRLQSDEHVDHINNDSSDNRLENLQVLTHHQNQLKSGRRKMVWITCAYCGAESLKFRNYVEHNRKMGKSGPYCDRSCSRQAQLEGE